MRKFLFLALIILSSLFSFSQEIFAQDATSPVSSICMDYQTPPTNYEPPQYKSATTCPAGTTRQTASCETLDRETICTLATGSFCCSLYPLSTQTGKQLEAYNECIKCLQNLYPVYPKIQDPAGCLTTEDVKTKCAVYTTAATGEWEGAFKEDPCTSLTKETKDTCRYCMYGNKYPAKDATIIGFWTGIGCISTNPMGAISQLTTFLLGVVGVFIFFQILIGAFTLLTSKGNPQAVQSARERITNSVIALLLIIFSVTILQFVGVNILHIPGFFDN